MTTDPSSPTLNPCPGPFEVCADKSSYHTEEVPLATQSASEISCKVVSLVDRRRIAPATTSVELTTPIKQPNPQLDGPPERNYDCQNYESCLNLAASLNWGSFTCAGCSGEINSALLWRAHQSQRKDLVAKAICGLKPIEQVEGSKGPRASGSDSDTAVAAIVVDTKE